MKPSDTQLYNRVHTGIEKFTQDYLDLGVAVLRDAWYDVGEKNPYYAHHEKFAVYRKEYLAILAPTFVRAYLRGIAKELKRPFVWAEYRGSNRVELTMPRLKKTEPMRAMFYLVGVKHIGLPSRSLPNTPVLLGSSRSIETITFQGDEGIAHFDAWIDQCRNDEDFRKILRTHEA